MPEKSRTPRSLTATLATAFLVLSVVVLLLAGSIQMVFNFQAQQETVAGKQQLIAQGAADTVAGFIQEKFSVLETAAKLGDLTSASEEQQKRTLQDLLGLDRALRQLVLSNSQDQALAKVSRVSQAAAEQLVDRIESGLYTQVRQGNRYISSVYIDDATSEPMVVVAIPATDIFGDFQGTLLAEVNLKFMWDLVDRLQIGETGLAYVVDKQGTLLAFGDIARVLQGEDVAHLKEVGEFISSPALVDATGASISSGINGTKIIGTYVPLGMPDWAVVTELPLSEAYREVIQSVAISLAVILAVAILAGLGGAYVARRLAVPLLNLTETATQITEGQVGLQAVPEGPSEVVSLATAFNSMTAQLREFIGTLEQRVADRTRDLERRTRYLEASAQVAKGAAAIRDVDQLLAEVALLISERFGFYHAGLFLVDEASRYAILRAASSEGGRRMLARGHRLRIGEEGVVGYAAGQGRARIALDVGVDAHYFDNPDLPLTRSEVALPLSVRDRVIGVLDVQSTEEAAFDQEDVAILQTVADQVAVALENARLLVEAEDRLRETQILLQRQSQEGWIRLSQERPAWSYTYDGVEVLPGHGVSEADVRSGLRVPVQVRDQAVGHLSFALLDRAATQEDLLLAQAVADQVGQALDSARLYQDTQRRATRDRLLGEVTARMRETLDIDTVLRTAIREIGQAMEITEVEVRLGRSQAPPDTSASGETAPLGNDGHGGRR
jgi:GAF domain-containing protein